MKAIRIFLVIASVAMGGMAAPTASGDLSALPGEATVFRLNPSLFMRDSRLPRSDALRMGRNYQVDGFLVIPFKAVREEGWRSVPRRWLRAVNPFGPAEARPAWTTSGNLSPRAWTTTVGWSPSAMVFHDPLVREPQMVLVSLQPAPRQD